MTDAVTDTAADLLAELASTGFEVRASAGRLVVTPGSRLTAELTARLRANKEALLLLLGGVEPAGPWKDASAARVIAGVLGELEGLPVTARGAHATGALDLIADGLAWLAEDVRDRNAGRLAERAGWLSWLAGELKGWTAGTIDPPPREVAARRG